MIEQVSRTEKSELNRKDADKKYGFDLYQGGAPKGSDVRILRISDHDIQACGGTHHDDLRQIGSYELFVLQQFKMVLKGCKLLPEMLLEIIQENRKITEIC